MKKRLACLVLLLALLSGVTGAWAQASWRDLPPDERRQMRQQMRESWRPEGALPGGEGGAAWRDLPPEERRRLRSEMREQHHELPGRDLPPPDFSPRPAWRGGPGRGGRD